MGLAAGGSAFTAGGGCCFAGDSGFGFSGVFCFAGDGCLSADFGFSGVFGGSFAAGLAGERGFGSAGFGLAGEGGFSGSFAGEGGLATGLASIGTDCSSAAFGFAGDRAGACCCAMSDICTRKTHLLFSALRAQLVRQCDDDTHTSQAYEARGRKHSNSNKTKTFNPIRLMLIRTQHPCRHRHQRHQHTQ